MYLSKLKVEKFRSLEDTEIEFKSWKNIIVWKNNSGKSNILKAINLVIWEIDPSYSRYLVEETDFYYDWESYSDEFNIALELMVNKQDFLNLLNKDKNLFKKSIAKEIDTIGWNLFNIDIDKYTWFNLEKKEEWITKKIINSILNYSENELKFTLIFRAFFDEEEVNKINKDFRMYLELQDKYYLFQKPIFRSEFFQAAIIPSFRDPNTQLKISKWSWYWKLMKKLVEEKLQNKKIKEKVENLVEINKKISDFLSKEINDDIVSDNINFAFPGVNVSFQFLEDTSSEYYKNIVIHVDDGYKSLLFDKWSWIQSVVVIWLFIYYVKNYLDWRKALLCLEESELYLHPHACRAINDSLKSFLALGNQVIITTHSPEFLKIENEDINVIRVWKDWNKSVCKNLSIDKKIKLHLIDTEKVELFFADKVILCEGFESYILKLAFWKELNLYNISVVNVWWKDSLSEFVNLCMNLWIRPYVITDFDYFLRDNDSELLKKYNVKRHENILSLKNMILECDKSKWWNVIRYIDKVRNSIKKSCEEKFYTAKNKNEIINCLENKFKDKIDKLFEYVWNLWILILPWEIEDLIKDKYRFILKTNSWNKKLNFDSILDIKKLLLDGEYLENIIDLSLIKSFVDKVCKN